MEKNNKYDADLYLRLSREDGDKAESDSIVNLYIPLSANKSTHLLQCFQITCHLFLKCRTVLCKSDTDHYLAHTKTIRQEDTIWDLIYPKWISKHYGE